MELYEANTDQLKKKIDWLILKSVFQIIHTRPNSKPVSKRIFYKCVFDFVLTDTVNCLLINYDLSRLCVCVLGIMY